MVKKFKPTTPGRRQLVQPSTDELSKKGNNPLKALLRKQKRISGRNNQGHLI